MREQKAHMVCIKKLNTKHNKQNNNLVQVQVCVLVFDYIFCDDGCFGFLSFETYRKLSYLFPEIDGQINQICVFL